MRARHRAPTGGRTRPASSAAVTCRPEGPGSASTATGALQPSRTTRARREKSAGLRSRGHLVTGFLQSGLSPLEYLQTIRRDDYAGFNLFVADRTTLAYLSNRGGGLQELPAGIYGLSNATLDAPWEKVERSKERLGRMFADGRINETQLLRLLGDRDKSPVHEVKSDRLPFAVAHAITAPFIITTEYGTRCSTIVRADSGGQWRFHERRFDASGNNVGESQYSFRAGENSD